MKAVVKIGGEIRERTWAGEESGNLQRLSWRGELQRDLAKACYRTSKKAEKS